MALSDRRMCLAGQLEEIIRNMLYES